MRNKTGSLYIGTLKNTERNLIIFIELAGFYKNGKPHKILEFTYPLESADRECRPHIKIESGTRSFLNQTVSDHK